MGTALLSALTFRTIVSIKNRVITQPKKKVRAMLRVEKKGVDHTKRVAEPKTLKKACL